MSLGNKKIMANNIKRLMKNKGVNASIVCSDLNISMSTFSDWCNAKTYPRIDKIELLSNYFNVPKSELVEEYISPSSKFIDGMFANAYREVARGGVLSRREATSILSIDAIDFLNSVTPVEIELIKNYRAASEKEKRIVDDVLDVEERELEKPDLGLDDK